MIPDAPWIREAELWGMPPYDEVEVYCPICGRECETIYKDSEGTEFGCNNCVKEIDARDWAEEFVGADYEVF